MDKLKLILENKDKKKIIITGVILLVMVYRIFFVGGFFSSSGKYEIDTSSSNTEQSSKFIDKDDRENFDKNNDSSSNKFSVNKDDAKPQKIKVYITGAVASPGVICVDSNKRLDDAICMAGGLLENADINRMNLAMKLEDSQHYIIPYIGQDSNSLDDLNSKDVNLSGNDLGLQKQNDGSNKSGKVNINTADQSKLEEIPGVGPATAKKIIEYREKSGGFKTIDDIKNVTGIGDKKFENMRDSIDVR